MGEVALVNVSKRFTLREVRVLPLALTYLVQATAYALAAGLRAAAADVCEARAKVR